MNWNLTSWSYRRATAAAVVVLERRMTYIPLPLQVHVEQELLIYEAFPYDQQQPQNNLKVRFKKVSLPMKP